jgi:signal transduction histidine kinase
VQETTQRKFSQDHDFSQAQVAVAATLVAKERRSKRLFLNVTTGHRRMAMRQVIVSSTVGAFTMLSLYLAELSFPSIDRSTLNAWGVATLANIIARAAMNYWTFTHSPGDMANSIALRLVPLIVVVLTAVQWIWTVYLFIGQVLSIQVLILFAGFLGVSVAVMGMWPTSPVAAATYLLTAWPPFFVALYQTSWATGPVLGIVGVSVALVLWACVFLEVNQVQSILNRSDEADLLLARLHQSNAELKQANGLLDAMRQSARSELESRSMFFSSASHDFRQRLHAMKLLSHSAIHETNSPPTKANAPLDRLADAVEDVERYITELLDFARLDGSGLVPNRSRVKLQDLFQQVDLNFEEVAAANGVDLTVRPTGAVLRTDPAMMLRVLENLVSNAIKFSANRRVVVAARRRRGSVVIEIWDQGPGILPEAQSAIFTPFYQSSVSRAGIGGVGLGLAVVKRFSDCMGYEVSVRSRPGHGTVMRVLVSQADVDGSSEGDT